MAPVPDAVTAAEEVALGDGRVVTVRPIDPSDAPALVRFHESLSPATVQSRFFGAHPHLSDAEARRFTDVDGRRRFALVATEGGRIVAVGRCEPTARGDREEVAFVVADELQGHGLGAALLDRLARWAREAGYAELSAVVLFNNLRMHRLLAGSGLRRRSVVRDGVVEVVLSLDEAV